MTPSTDHTVLTAMLAPAFFLTATASLLLSANNRLARIIDRARTLLRELADVEEESERSLLEKRIALQRQRSLIILRAGQLLYAAISCFVGTSLAVAVDTFTGHRLGSLPTWLAAVGVVALLALIVWLRPAPVQAVAVPATVSYAQIKPVIEQRCAMCHGEALQSKNVRLDSPDALKQHAQAVYQQAVVTRAMPMNNATGLTEEERALIGQWFKSGAKVE